jgi:tRNA threonylcarbamoyladenosine biosynthesis protein TsaE
VAEITIETGSAEQTEQVGVRLAPLLNPGDVVLVAGELGAGKTTLVRGACRALGVSEQVTSPTFVIGAAYNGRSRVAHVDLYRLDDLTGEDPSLLADYLRPDSIAFVEWPERAADALDAEPVALRLRIEHAGEDRRSITGMGRGELIEALAASPS